MGEERSRERAEEVEGVESTVWPATVVLPLTMRRVGWSEGERRAEDWAHLQVARIERKSGKEARSVRRPDFCLYLTPLSTLIHLFLALKTLRRTNSACPPSPPHPEKSEAKVRRTFRRRPRHSAPSRSRPLTQPAHSTTPRLPSPPDLLSPLPLLLPQAPTPPPKLVCGLVSACG